MKYLLDVNALLALGIREHEFHSPVAHWVIRADDLATCSITELGFLRVLSNTRPYGTTLSEAQSLLVKLRRSYRLSFIADELGASDLPTWVRTADQITDGHLSELARSNGALLATVDRKIPGAFLIPRAENQ